MTPEERKEKVAELRKHHEDTFAALGIPKAYFCAKHAHVPTGWDSKAIGLYPSELSHGDSVYIEFVTMDYDIVDANRMLYVFDYTPDFATKYPVKKEQHLIPVEELKVVAPFISDEKRAATTGLLKHKVEMHQSLPKQHTVDFVDDVAVRYTCLNEEGKVLVIEGARLKSMIKLFKTLQ